MPTRQRRQASTASPRPAAAAARGAAGARRDAASATQSLDRALRLLEHVVDHARAGIALPALSGASGLTKPTAHRLLSGLRNAGLVDYDAATRLFSPSFKLYRMGLAAAVRFNVAELAAPAMERLAAATGDTVYLSVRSGDHAVCVARRVGAFPIKTLTLEVGDARPLGLGAGSLALLAALDDGERDDVLARVRGELERHAKFTLPDVRGYCAEARRAGYTINDGMMLPEMGAVGMVIRDAHGRACGALSIAAIRSRIQPPRRRLLIKLLRDEIGRIEASLAAPQGDA
jgi:DNA-binding IclR family transcriptional regulator